MKGIIGGNRIAIYAKKFNSTKNPALVTENPALVIERTRKIELDGEKVTHLETEVVAFFKSEEHARIFEDALFEMFQNGDGRILQNYDEYIDCMKFDLED